MFASSDSIEQLADRSIYAVILHKLLEKTVKVAAQNGDAGLPFEKCDLGYRVNFCSEDVAEHQAAVTEFENKILHLSAEGAASFWGYGFKEP